MKEWLAIGYLITFYNFFKNSNKSKQIIDFFIKPYILLLNYNIFHTFSAILAHSLIKLGKFSKVNLNFNNDILAQPLVVLSKNLLTLS